MQGSGESPTLAKNAPVIKDTDERHAVNLAGVFAQSDNKSLMYKHLFNILNEPI